MTETVVHVTTLEQWKSVLDVWYKQGHYWLFTNTKYKESIFEDGGRYLFLDDCITYSINNYHDKPFIEYSEFMAQQKGDNKMTTYYVTQEQLDLIEDIKNAGPFVSSEIAFRAERFKELVKYFDDSKDKALLRYLGGDETIGFKVKEPLYRLWRIDGNGNKVYMRFTSTGTPDWTTLQKNVFIAPLDEIKKWQTPAWEIEKAD